MTTNLFRPVPSVEMNAVVEAHTCCSNALVEDLFDQE